MRLLIVAAAALLGACTPAAEETEVMSEGCDARAVSEWAAGEARYSIEAGTAGPDCARAVATLVVRDSSGAPVYAEAYMTAYVMTLSEARDPVAMQTALDQWVDASADTSMATTAALPDWPENATLPGNGEFPFYVEPEWSDRRGYEELRARASPLFCYVQGMESMNCIAVDNGSVNRVGVQSFPG